MNIYFLKGKTPTETYNDINSSIDSQISINTVYNYFEDLRLLIHDTTVAIFDNF